MHQQPTYTVILRNRLLSTRVPPWYLCVVGSWAPLIQLMLSLSKQPVMQVIWECELAVHDHGGMTNSLTQDTAT